MQFLGEDYATYGLDDILTSIRKAKENDKIKGIYIDAGAFRLSDSFHAGYTTCIG